MLARADVCLCPNTLTSDLLNNTFQVTGAAVSVPILPHVLFLGGGIFFFRIFQPKFVTRKILLVLAKGILKEV